MRSLVTGGSGFIGASVARRLLARGETTVLSRRRGDGHRLDAVGSAVRIAEGDLLDAASVRRVVAECQPEAVVHLAAAGVTPGIDAAAVVEANLVGTAHLLSALCASPGLRSIVVIGSWYEYGAALTSGADRVPAPATPYGISKFAATLMTQEFAARHGLPAVVLRPFQVYGPDEPAHRLIPQVLRGALLGQPVALQNPTAARDWVEVEDVARACECAIDRAASGGEPIDIGTGVATPVGEVVRRALLLAGFPAVSSHDEVTEVSPDSHLSGAADIRAAASRLAWQAEIDLDAGLRRTVEQYLYDHRDHAPR